MGILRLQAPTIHSSGFNYWQGQVSSHWSCYAGDSCALVLPITSGIANKTMVANSIRIFVMVHLLWVIVAHINTVHLVWSGLVWSGLVWSGLVWSGLVWSGLVWSGLAWP